MKALLFLVSLTLVGTCFGVMRKCHFHIDIPAIKYAFDGFAYVDDTPPYHIVTLKAPVSAPFNGTIKDDVGSSHPTSGKLSIADPPIEHLNDVMVGGTYFPEKVTYNGKFMINPLDITKKEVPVKGNVKLSNGKQGDATGSIENFMTGQCKRA